jgi:hypothetical protein
MTCEMKDIISSILKMSSPVVDRWRTVPFTRVSIFRRFGSMPSTIHGPTGAKVS